MTVGNIVTTIVLAIVGGSGFVGILFYFIRRYIEKRLGEKEDEDKKKREQRLKRIKAEDELMHCQGRLFFWMHKAIVTGEHNGDLEEAFEAYQDAEKVRKDLDREILAENELG
ncbi:MAG: hypothetical protein J5929_09340 [Eubacterium sp.]|nr:hypothetical protein [Eubacterium sp.]